MVVELPHHASPRALPLFGELDYHLSIAAVIAGAMPGHVFADDEAAPRAALVTSPEGNYLSTSGLPAGEDLAAARAMVDQLRAAGPQIGLFAAPRWERDAAALFAGERHALLPRRRYALSALAGAWHEQVPEGLTLARIDAAALARPALQEHHVGRWARGNWGSAEAFAARGFGFALLQGELPVSWCLADSAVDGRCEVGIHTHPDFRRRGLATVVVAAAVAHALASGHREVGWHCAEANAGSQGVAEKVGFRLTHRFHVLVCGPEGEG